MKQFLVLLCIAFATTGFAQQRVIVPQERQAHSIKQPLFLPVQQEYSGKYLPLKQSSILGNDEEEIGDTRYDNQTNASIPKKIYYYEDGTIAATWTRSMEEGTFFNDRGTGYNYYDGQQWGEWPLERIEDLKVHRPVYAPWGENGEMVISHTSGSGLYMATRETKGSGDWDFDIISGPPGEDYLVWARAVTSGADRTRIHLLSLTLPESHGGQPYLGLNGALLYSLSEDGGASWIIEHEILEGMSSDEYHGFPGDTYAFAEPAGDAVAFVVGDPWTGLFLMKSTDGGFVFEKTTIWEHPYPDWEPGMAADTFYCADGSHSVALDENGMAHVVFGITRVEADAQNTYWYPWVDGIAYWNETMPSFSDNLHALDPNGHPDSELEEDVTLVGWTQDLDNNGQLEFLDDLGIYSIGLSSMPQLVVQGNEMALVFSSVTENYDNGVKNYRHIWLRWGNFDADNNTTQWGIFEQLTDDLVHIFDECVYPAVAPRLEGFGKLHMIYQADPEPGIATWYQQHPYVDNRIVYLKTDYLFGLDDRSSMDPSLAVEQNYPNPFSDNTVIKVENRNSARLVLQVSDPTGKVVYADRIEAASQGTFLFRINNPDFAPGFYFYSVSDGTNTVTRKMVVE